MMTQTWRKRADPAIEVEALKLSHENAREIVHWCEGRQVQEIDPYNSTNTYVGVNVPTYDGRQRASEGDYVVWDLDLGFTVRKPGLFEALFELIS